MGTKEPGFDKFLKELIFWGGLVLLAAWAFVGMFLPAVQERKATRDWVRTLRHDQRLLEDERDRLAVQKRAYEEMDPSAIEQAVRNLGFVPPDRVRVISADAPEPVAPGTAPKGTLPKPK